jgi:hypothetical protein
MTLDFLNRYLVVYSKVNSFGGGGGENLAVSLLKADVTRDDFEKKIWLGLLSTSSLEGGREVVGGGCRGFNCCREQSSWLDGGSARERVGRN